MKRVKPYYRRKRAYLFVDGYNVLNSWFIFEREREGGFENARKKLMDTLVDYTHYTGQAVVLVLDGYKIKKNLEKEFHYKGIQVVSTKAMQTADHYIEQELTLIGRHRNVRVAINDSTGRRMILSRGGKWISARELEVEVAHTKEGLVRRKRRLKSESKVSAWEEETLESLKGPKDRLDPH